jgi:hypothetical protein
MSATATTAAPAPTGLAQPAGPWKKLSKAMTAEIPAIAGRPVPVACAPGAGLGHPACYLPLVPVIEVDGKLLGVAPATANPASPADRQRYPVTWGALIHEGAHAAHSSFCPPPAPVANWCEAAHQLEESRAEHRQVTRRPGDRRWLRATVTRLILDDFTAAGADPSDPREAGAAAALILAREDAGILEPAETAPVAARVEAAIGPDRLARIRATWREAHQAADGDARTMVALARRWCRILGLDPDAAPPAPVEIDISDILDAIRDAIKAIAEAVEADFAPPPPPFPPGASQDREQEKDARGNADQAAREVFSRKGAAPAVTGTRDPRDEETSAARRLARSLKQNTAGGRDKVTTTSKVPPGRLRMGKALASQAQRAAGAVPTAEPFTSTRSRRVPAPPLRVGIACDISSSMGEFTGPVASAAWILGRAASHVPAALTATVLYGALVRALTWPGETPARVTEFAAPDYMHLAGLAIDALDGALGLARPGTARLLALVTDLNYDEAETLAAQRRITRLHRAGCGVIILRPRGRYWGSHEWTDCQVIDIENPADAIDAIARAANRALTA